MRVTTEPVSGKRWSPMLARIAPAMGRPGDLKAYGAPVTGPVQRIQTVPGGRW